MNRRTPLLPEEQGGREEKAAEVYGGFSELLKHWRQITLSLQTYDYKIFELNNASDYQLLILNSLQQKKIPLVSSRATQKLPRFKIKIRSLIFFWKLLFGVKNLEIWALILSKYPCLDTAACYCWWGVVTQVEGEWPLATVKKRWLGWFSKFFGQIMVLEVKTYLLFRGSRYNPADAADPLFILLTVTKVHWSIWAVLP